jgi:CBS domain-containing protein
MATGKDDQGDRVEQQDIRNMRVAEILHQEWPTLGPGDTVESAIKLFAETGISGAPVVDDGKLVGIITEGDLIFRDADVKAPGFLDILGGMIPLGNWDEYREEAMKSAGVTVDEVMTSDPVTVAPEATLSEAATVMAEQRKKILPVVEGERLAGVITRMDILTLHVLNPQL